jgi:hypothetical protein
MPNFSLAGALALKISGKATATKTNMIHRDCLFMTDPPLGEN